MLQTSIVIGEFDVNDDSVNTLQRSLPKIGSGCYRVVYGLDDQHVLKVAGGIMATNCNRAEVKEWVARSESDDGDVLARVLAHGRSFGWLVMERAEQTLFSWLRAHRPDEVNGDYDYSIRPLEKLAPRVYSIAAAMCDIHSQNVGITSDGRWVIIDYAGYGESGGDLDSI